MTVVDLAATEPEVETVMTVVDLTSTEPGADTSPRDPWPSRLAAAEEAGREAARKLLGESDLHMGHPNTKVLW